MGRLLFCFGIVFLFALDSICQINIKVGYSMHLPELDHYNQVLNAYNDSKGSKLVDGFGTNHLVSTLDLGVRYRIGKYFGIEGSTQFGQSGNNKSSFEKSDKTLGNDKVNMRYISYSGGLVGYYKMSNFGISIDKVDLDFRRNNELNNKYISQDKSDLWATTFFIGFEARANRSSIAIRPFYQLALGEYGLSNLASSLGVGAINNGNKKPSNFGISILIFNGPEN
jgi:hypothetical protein